MRYKLCEWDPWKVPYRKAYNLQTLSQKYNFCRDGVKTMHGFRNHSGTAPSNVSTLKGRSPSTPYCVSSPCVLSRLRRTLRSLQVLLRSGIVIKNNPIQLPWSLLLCSKRSPISLQIRDHPATYWCKWYSYKPFWSHGILGAQYENTFCGPSIRTEQPTGWREH